MYSAACATLPAAPVLTSRKACLPPIAAPRLADIVTVTIADAPAASVTALLSRLKATPAGAPLMASE